jgi:hypothetical protein
VDLLQKGSNLSESALREYFDTLAESLESLRLDGKADPFDQAVIDSIDAFTETNLSASSQRLPGTIQRKAP